MTCIGGGAGGRVVARRGAGTASSQTSTTLSTSGRCRASPVSGMRPSSQVDDGRDQQGAGEHGGDREHGAGARRADDDDQQAHAIRSREGAEMAGVVRRRRRLVAEHELRQREHDDLDCDDGEEGPHDAPAAGAVGERGQLRHAAGDVGHGRRRRHALAAVHLAGIGGERPATGAALEVGVQQAGVDAGVLAVERAEMASRQRSHCTSTESLAAAGGSRWIGRRTAGIMSAVRRTLQRYVDATREGDGVALGELVRRTQPAVWQVCAALGSAGEEEDLVQETYLRALRALHSYRGEAPVTVWLLSIARRVCADHVRRRQRRRRLADRLVRHVGPDVGPPEVSDDLLRASIPTAARRSC